MRVRKQQKRVNIQGGWEWHDSVGWHKDCRYTKGEGQRMIVQGGLKEHDICTDIFKEFLV